MALETGRHLGPYEILSPLGAGRMGEVWRARDTKLNRDVALKVLPGTLARDPDRMARFKREAQVLAALNHPNIAAIYGFEESDATRALVMELVEGQTLAEVVGARHGVPLQDALPITKQIAEALEYAHEHGIIHRDLKPANVKVTPEGTVKVLDFGLAKALDPDVGAGLAPAQSGRPQGSPLQDSPTLTAAATQAGVIIGTAAYMSPEQARGKMVDRRADIWSFGCVLYEILTGKRPFEGETVTDVLASVVVKELDWEALPSDTPPRIREVIRRCLIKDPKQRLRDIGEARIAIEETISGVGADGVRPGEFARPTEGERRSPLQRALPWALAAISTLALVGLTLTAFVFHKPAAKPAEILFTIPPPEGTYPRAIAMSPDGKSIAFFANLLKGVGTASLWVRSLGTETSRHLADVDLGNVEPFWSPDSRTIGFFADGKLKTVPADGGPVQTICDAKDARGGTWNQNGVILFGELEGPVMQVRATGGTPTPVTPAEATYMNGFPNLLPDGNHFIYTKANDAGFQAVQVGSLDSKGPKTLLSNQGWAKFAPPDHLLFIRNGALMAQGFDPDRIELKGEPVPVTGVGAGIAFGGFSASREVLAYHAASTGGNLWFPTAQLTWYDRNGKKLGTVGPVGNYLEAVLSPDGKLVAANATLEVNNPWWNAHIFLLDLSNGVYSRMTLGTTRQLDPVWSSESRSVVYESGNQFMKLGVGQSEPTKVFSNNVLNYIDDWSRDGKFLITRTGPKTGVFALPMTGERKPILMVKDAFVRDQFHFSPDSRWVAYNSNESGQVEVYIASFPKMDHKHQVSTGGGSEPLWKGDGKELYYLTPDGKLMAVNVTEGTDVETSALRMLFQTNLKVNNGADQYAVTADGRKFLLVEPVKTQSTSAEPAEPIHVIVNWVAALAKP